jgi:peptidyl-prolyl cis-trans isomerase D
MINFFRRFEKSLLTALTIVVIVTFVVLYGGPGARMDKLGSDNVGRVAGRDVSSLEYLRLGRNFELCRIFGMFELLISLTPGANTPQDSADAFVWNTIVLRQKADQLGINPTEEQVLEAIQKLPAFQNQGKFDHDRYKLYMQMALGPRGMSEEDFEELIRDSVRVNRIKNLLGASTQPSKAELMEAYAKDHQQVEASVVRFARDNYAKDVAVSDEDVKKAYEQRKSTLKAPEKRKVRFVQFNLTEEQKKLTGKEMGEALQKLADQASEFSTQALAKDANFETLAKNAKLEIKTTEPFGLGEPREEFGKAPGPVSAAFQLSDSQSTSDPVVGDKSYFVLNLVETQPSREMTLDEARERLSQSLKSERTNEKLQLAAADARKKIEPSVKAGKPFAEAAKEAGVEPVTLKPFSARDVTLDAPDAQEIKSAIVELQDGNTSNPVNTSAGLILVHVHKRLPIDEKAFEKDSAEIKERLASSRSEALLNEWILIARNETSVEVLRKPRQP